MRCKSKVSWVSSHPSPTYFQTKINPVLCPWPSPLGESQHPLSILDPHLLRVEGTEGVCRGV